MDFPTLYKEHAYPGKKEFIRLAKQKNLSEKAAEEWYAKQEDVQLYKLPKKRTMHRVPITEWDNYHYYFVMDLMDMSKYGTRNKNFNWILTAKERKTNRVWAVPLKNKTAAVVTEGIKSIFKDLPEPNALGSVQKSMHGLLVKLDTDDGNEFRGPLREYIDDLYKTRNIHVNHVLNKEGDKTRLGAVERLNLTILTRLRKHFARTEKVVWIDIIDAIVKNYNESHNALTPDGTIKEPRPLRKTKPDTPEFKVDDYARFRLKRKTFDKKTLTPMLSSVYKVTEVNGVGSIKLSNGKVYHQNNLEHASKPAEPAPEPTALVRTNASEAQQVAKETRIRTLTSRSNVKPTHEVLAIDEQGNVTFKPRLQPASEKRKAGKPKRFNDD